MFLLTDAILFRLENAGSQAAGEIFCNRATAQTVFNQPAADDRMKSRAARATRVAVGVPGARSEPTSGAQRGDGVALAGDPPAATGAGSYAGSATAQTQAQEAMDHRGRGAAD